VTRRIAIASCDRLLPDGDVGDVPFTAALQDRGIEVSVLSWTDPSVDWAGFDATVIRSTWDYPDRRGEFAAWLQRVPRLHNPASVVSGNTEKIYLRDLALAGLPVVETEFVEPGSELSVPTTGEYVVKPTIGAGSRGAGRYDSSRSADADRALAHVAALHSVGLTVMVQPYLSAVDTEGESALIFIDGRFSHSIRKGRMLAEGAQYDADHPELYLAESITDRIPSDQERAVAEQFVEHLTKVNGGRLLYSRIDLLPSASGPVLVEAELTEPSLFLTHREEAGVELADALLERI
jgi:glutathione synthase/RimK-type ligase-like ATP-grasp enzyme